jgi:hypothetical protein
MFGQKQKTTERSLNGIDKWERMSEDYEWKLCCAVKQAGSQLVGRPSRHDEIVVHFVIICGGSM